MALKIYKPGQGRYVRLGTAGGMGLVALVVCWYLFNLLRQYVADDVAYKVYLMYSIPAVLFAALGLVGAKYLNHPRLADFLIATEGEMKKVAWSSKAEVVGSTLVVIVTVVLLAAFIFAVDLLVSGGLSSGWIIPYTDIRIPGLGLW